ncbi:hypothetical protein M231_05526 [Tremella mesenterica]|uniref:Uncharacterized protein n=1 Tax=Tremella mesenterica TaxID=5217 RepID=A0A4Q1BI27_TREME|nr:hypothetical protein M231_05526 [Tremella mesenterica]
MSIPFPLSFTRQRLIISFLVALLALAFLLHPFPSRYGGYGYVWLTKASGAKVDGNGAKELMEKLESFVRRPAWDHPVLEYPSRQGCPMGTMDRDGYFFHQGKTELWTSISSMTIRQKRQALLDYFKKLQIENIPIVWSKDLLQQPFQTLNPGKPLRGIIYAAGDGKALKRLRLSLHMLRNVVKSTLPIEIYHYPDELLQPGDKEGLIQDFGEGIITVEMNHAKVDGKQWRGFGFYYYLLYIPPYSLLTSCV